MTIKAHLPSMSNCWDGLSVCLYSVLRSMKGWWWCGRNSVGGWRFPVILLFIASSVDKLALVRQCVSKHFWKFEGFVWFLIL